MFTSSGKRVKQGPKAAAQRKLGLAARISYAIGGIIALLWLVYFLIPYSQNKIAQEGQFDTKELWEKAVRLYPKPEPPRDSNVDKDQLFDIAAIRPDELQPIQALFFEWERETGKSFLHDHPSTGVFDKKSQDILHTTDGREPLLMRFGRAKSYKDKDYTWTISFKEMEDNKSSELHIAPMDNYITPLDFFSKEFVEATIKGEISYIKDGKSHTLKLPEATCAFKSEYNRKVQSDNRYGDFNIIDCRSWWSFVYDIYHARTDKEFLKIHPLYEFGEVKNRVAFYGAPKLSDYFYERSLEKVRKKRLQWFHEAQSFDKHLAEQSGFRVFGYFLFFLAITAFFIVNKPYGFINLPNGIIKPRTLKYILGFSVFFGLIYSFGVTKEMESVGIFLHIDTSQKVIFSSLLVFFCLLLFFPAFYGAVEWIKETETYRKLFVYGKGGSARWGSIKTYMKYDFSDYMKQLRAGKFRQDKSAPIYCGRTAWRNDLMLGCRDIGLNNNSHMLTVSTTGGGKSLYVCWNELLSWPGGAFIFDPKGEHAERTFHVRKQHMDCYALDPSGAINKNADIPFSSYNPFDEIDVKNNNAGADLRGIIRASVYEEKSESANSKYFKDKAIEIALGYSVHLLTKYPKKYHNLPSMFDLFLMGSPDGVGVDENALKKLHAEMMVNEAVGGAAMIAAKTLKDAGEKGELGGIKNSFSTAFQWVKDEAITRTLKSSSFSMKDIRKKDASVYVCVRLDNLDDEHYVRWFRTISTMALQATREQISSRYKTLFLFDEFYHLGTFEPVASGLTKLRGQNVKLHLFFQNIGQIKARYKNTADFLSSCDKQFFGVTENETAEEISKQLGKYIEKWPEGSEDHPRYNERERLLRPSSEILGQLAKGKTEQYIIPTDGFPMELELTPFYKNFDQYGEVYNEEKTYG